MRFAALLPLLAGAVSAWQSAVPLARHGTALRRAAVHAKEEEVVFTFGDADDMSDSTATAIMGEERELTEREKEIARLRAAEKFIQKATGNAKCNTCGYKYKWEEGAPGIPKRTPFELVPDSWSCPNCKSPKAFFAAETIEIAGFEDNQKYGFGTNTWTESQKSTAIFGGLAAFFALFISGYALVSQHSALSISHDPLPSRHALPMPQPLLTRRYGPVVRSRRTDSDLGRSATAMAARSGDGESCALLLMSFLACGRSPAVCGKVPRTIMPCACDALFCFCRPSSPKPKCAGGCPADIEAVCAAWIRGQIFCMSRDLVFIIHVAVRLNERQHPCMQISFTANVHIPFANVPGRASRP